MYFIRFIHQQEVSSLCKLILIQMKPVVGWMDGNPLINQTSLVCCHQYGPDCAQINLPYSSSLSAWYYLNHPPTLLRPSSSSSGGRQGLGGVWGGGYLAWAPALTPTACGRPGSPRARLILLFSVRLEAAGLPQTGAPTRPLSAE